MRMSHHSLDPVVVQDARNVLAAVLPDPDDDAESDDGSSYNTADADEEASVESFMSAADDGSEYLDDGLDDEESVAEANPRIPEAHGQDPESDESDEESDDDEAEQYAQENDGLIVETVSDDEEDQEDDLDEGDDAEEAEDDDALGGAEDDDALGCPDDDVVEEMHNVARAMDEKYGKRSGAYSLRDRKPPKYPHSHVHAQMDSEKKQGVPTTTMPKLGVRSRNRPFDKFKKRIKKGTTSNRPLPTPVAGEEAPLATPQMSMKAGLKMFGEDGRKAVSAEVKQLHDRNVMRGKLSKDLTREQRKEALAYYIFLKRKNCGKIKARGCADGRKQRAHIDKYDASSPTVSTEAVYLTAVNDAMEGRVVSIADCPGAFMGTDQPLDETIHVRFTGTMVELLVEIDEGDLRPTGGV